MGEATDPTIAFLAKLNDPRKWAVRRNVPIFVPHKRGEIEVTERDLPVIAAEMERAKRERGVVGRVTDRHTIEPTPDGKGQRPVYPPPVVYGYQVNPRVGTFGPQNTPCILVDWHLYPEHAAKCDRMPYRSVEYQHNRRLIRGTAVMVNDPYLDMGMVAFESDGGKVTLYSYAGDAMNENGNANAEQKQGEEQFTPEETKMFEKCRAYMRTKYALGEEWPGMKKEEAAPEAPKPGEEKKEDVAAMQTNATIAAYQAQLASLNATVQGLQLERDLERCTMLVTTGLAGYSLSDAERNKEIGKLQKLAAAERAERIEELKRIYAEREVPQGKFAAYQGASEPGARQVTEGVHAAPWYHEPAMQYMRDEPGMTYEAAVSEIRKRAGK